jgi:integrase
MASIRKRKWGKNKELEAWIVDYRDQGGKRAIKTFATKKEAEAWRVAALHEVQLGTHTRASASKTVAEVWDLWLNDCEANGLEFSTVRQRRQHFNHHVRDLIVSIRLADLSAPLVYDFDSKLRDAGRSLAMRRKVLVSVKTMLGFAQGRRLVAQNVARGVRIKTDTREASQGPLRAGVDFPSMAELRSIIETTGGRWRPFIVTAIFTGMRASELRGLIWKDADLESGVIHVRQRADAWGKIGPPKSKAGKRDIPLAPIVLNALRQWRLGCPKGELGLVFPTGAGNVKPFSNVQQQFWMPIQIKCGLTNEAGGHRYGFHMLRHAAASLFIQHLNWTPKRLQTVMGHSSINMTFDLYGHLFENIDRDREDMARIEAAVRVA